jgi:predicted amidophosphoribosyltransferase
MHFRLCMHQRFDLITNPFKYKCETCQNFIHSISKNCDECKMELASQHIES